MEFKHISVLLNEMLSGLNISPDGLYLDCTLGGAGHSQEILKRLSPKGHLYGVDKDQDALNFSQEKLKNFKNVTYIKSDYNELDDKLPREVFFDGILLDLGVSSYQIDTAERGFSFLKDGPLDMRMDKESELTAYDVVNTYSQKDLEKILFLYGEEDFAKQIVRAILKARQEKPIQTTKELNDIIENSVPFKYRLKGAAKKTFQAIRIEVNQELEHLTNTINFLATKLKKGGRMAIITFHSLEDRIVKQAFAFLEKDCICPPKTPVCICGKKQIVKLVNKKPILPSEEELAENNRSRSAKLRICEKV
ncbi:MAG: 16S rRNA (cytosine(1402)-N(4))-methyltransferase RsmH [Christensenellales bacterium]|jgi:16S rRNA (cytosine1402-N4)-methyltransferase